MPTSLPVRMMASVHRLVLEGNAPELAKFYPSAGGTVDLDLAWTAFSQAIQQNLDRLSQYIAVAVQMNDIERSAGLLGGFGLIAEKTKLPLRLLEIGASAGLNLRWDHYHYQWRGGSWGAPNSLVRFKNIFAGNSPTLPSTIAVVERIGCDLNPIDVEDPAGRLTLLSYVFPDETDRIRDLRAAIDIARKVPCDVQKANAADWLASRLERPAVTVGTVVFHSIMWQYMSAFEQQRVARIIEEAGSRASADAPLAWLRMEPGHDRPLTQGYEVTLRIYPGFHERVIAIFQHACHVPSVEWLLDEG
jgi:hypothetical protein